MNRTGKLLAINKLVSITNELCKIAAAVGAGEVREGILNAQIMLDEAAELLNEELERDEAANRN